MAPWRFSLTNTAPVAGVNNVTSTFVGTLQGSNTMGTITVGAGGQLPSGRPIIWDVTLGAVTMAAAPAVRVNGYRQNYVAAQASELLRPSVSMRPGTQLGQAVDWWLIAAANGNYFHFDLASSTWQAGIAVTYTGPLSSIPIAQLPYARLPSGAYDIYFGFDTVPDGVLTLQSAVYESVHLTVP